MKPENQMWVRAIITGVLLGISMIQLGWGVIPLWIAVSIATAPRPTS